MKSAELKSNLHLLIDSIRDNKTLNTLYTVISGSLTESQKVRLSEAEKRAVDQSLKSISEGKTYSTKDVISEMKKKHPKLYK